MTFVKQSDEGSEPLIAIRKKYIKRKVPLPEAQAAEKWAKLVNPPPKQLVWKPNPGPQYNFLRAVASHNYYEIFYGGARGGGKTDAGIMSLLYDKYHQAYRALVIRKNADDLKDWSDRAAKWYLTQGASKIGNPPEFTFKEGGKIRTGHLKDDNAFSKYQGHEYHKMLVEELTQIPTEENYLKLASSCRSTIPELRPCIISTGNPDGPGFNWVRKRFNLHGIPTGPVETTDPITNLKRIFIPAHLADNPHLSVDPQYKAFLDGLPDGLREAWRDGSWDDPNIEGGYYTLAIAQARREGRIGKVPYDPQYRVYTVWDLGIGEQLVCGFFQKTKGGELHLIDTWQGQDSDALPQAVNMLQARTFQKGYNYGKHFAPHDATRHEIATGLTVIDSAIKLGVNFEKIEMMPFSHRVDKCLTMFPRLHVNESTSETFMSAVTQYRKEWDEKRLDWKETPFRDWSNHFSDMLSYASLVEDEMMEGITGSTVSVTIAEDYY